MEASNKGWSAVRFADKSCNIRVTDLTLLPSDAASFEPSQAPLSAADKIKESSNRGLSVAAFSNDAASPITSMAGTLGPAFAS